MLTASVKKAPGFSEKCGVCFFSIIRILASNLFSEAHEASKMAGSNHERASEMIDLGLWSHDLCDPETAIGGSLYVPIGPWATCKYT